MLINGIENQLLEHAAKKLDELQMIRQFLENNHCTTITDVYKKEKRMREYYWEVKKHINSNYTIAGVPNES